MHFLANDGNTEPIRLIKVRQIKIRRTESFIKTKLIL